MTIQKTYKSKLSLIETEKAIKYIKDFFQDWLSNWLWLTRVSAPLFVKMDTGINDDLNGTERAIWFETKSKDSLQVIHSLAKWKRLALQRYGFEIWKWLYTDMNAIRRDEDLDEIHSYYVDQRDWEKIIKKEDRTFSKLKETVKIIYEVFKDTEKSIKKIFESFIIKLPDEIHFVTTQELEDIYPTLTSKEREYEITRKYKAVFLMQIWWKLESWIKHDGRAPDYDDWKLNGDILVRNPILEDCFELSSMWIRVDEKALLKQLKISSCEDRKELMFHKMLLEWKLPYTMWWGIWQSRLCMFFLEKAHIWEVQSSVWDKETIEKCESLWIMLL